MLLHFNYSRKFPKINIFFKKRQNKKTTENSVVFSEKHVVFY